jgi:RHS repeat-associated protein
VTRVVAVVLSACLVSQFVPSWANAVSDPLPAPLYWSANPDRIQGGNLLQDATLTGPVAIYLNTAVSVGYTSAAFYLDGALFSTDNLWPFDFNGTQPCAAQLNNCPAGNAIMFDPTTLRQGLHTITAKAKTASGTVAIPDVSGTFRVVWPTGVIPRVYPDPVSGGVRTNTADASKFLYTGDNPPQTGVSASTIDPAHAAVVRGRVLNLDGSPLAGAVVTVDGHPEYGQTYSQTDGYYDLAVNGGSALTINLAKSGLIKAQRTVTPAWQDWSVADPATLLPYDSNSVTITPGSLTAGSFGVARGSTVNDAAGTRQSTLLVPAGTNATLLMPDGTTKSTSTLTVQQTEFTVGSGGHQAMPAPLPASSAYTYAVDMSIAEMRTNGAVGVAFSQPVWHYNENFLNFPVGSVVPTGFYDYKQHAWVPSDNGLVVKILSVTAGKADLDLDGTGVPGSAAAYAAIGMADGERTQLASLYSPGASLWRVGMRHFCPWDMNWPFRLASDAVDPFWRGLSGLIGSLLPNCTGAGSIIGCESQSLGEQVPLIGSGTRMTYQSTRVPDSHNGAVSVQVTPATVPSSLVSVEVTASVAGRTFHTTLPARANERYSFDWDGKDAFGRQLNGTQRVTFQLSYVYQGQYATSLSRSSRFGNACADPCVLSGVSTDASRAQITLTRTVGADLYPSVVADARGDGLGGWLLGMHQSFDPRSQVLSLGDGSSVKLAPFGASVLPLAGNGTPGSTGDGGQATAAALNFPGGATFDPAGNLYVSDTFNDRIRKITPNGVISTFAGTGTTGYNGDGGLAVNAQLHSPLELTAGADGSVIFADVDNHRVRRIDPTGLISTVAGDGNDASSGDGGSATAASLSQPVSVALAADGTLYIADYQSARIRKVSPDGAISSFAGTGTPGFVGDNGPATAARLYQPSSLVLDVDGNLLVADTGNHRIRKITPDGIISTVAGSGTAGSAGDGGPATSAQLDHPVGLCLDSTGALYIADETAQRIRRLALDGTISTWAGNGAAGFTNGLTAATATAFNLPRSLTVSPDGSLVVADAGNNRVRRVTSAPLGLVSGSYLIPSPDRKQVYIFDPDGRHQKTVDGLTGIPHYTFTYDSLGRLAGVTDHDNNQIVISHPDSTHVQIQAPDNNTTTLTLDTNGWATAITDPGGTGHTAAYSTGGLLTSFTDRNQNPSSFKYDSVGRLWTDTGRDGQTTTLTRTEFDNGYRITLTTPMGRATTHDLTVDANNVVQRTVTDQTGEAQTERRFPDGTSLLTTAASTLTTVVLPDPRWGMISPQPSRTTVRASGHQPVTTSTTQSLTLNGNDPLNVASQTITQTQGSLVWTTRYLKGDSTTPGTITATSPLGRTSVTTLDGNGRVASTQSGNLLPVTFSYDSRGRLSGTSRGSGTTARTTGITYDAQGFPHTTTNSLQQVTTYTNDPLGDPKSVTGPAGTLTTGYDDNANTKTITPPGSTTYTIGYEPDDRPNSYTLPDTDNNPNNDTYTYALNHDRQYSGLKTPSGDTLSIGYDAAGRTTSITRGSDTITYDWTGGELHTATSADNITTTVGYTGTLPTHTTTTGAGLTTSVDQTVDDQLRPLTQTVANTPAVSYGYENDGLLQSAGSVTLTRDTITGALTGFTVGTSSATTLTPLNGFGEPTRATTTQAGSTVYDVQYTNRDNAGRLTDRTETLGGVTNTDHYDYDSANRLQRLTRNGAEVANYSYYDNGDLKTETHGTSVITSTYDAQDRIRTRGTLSYVHNDNGERTSVSDSATNTTTSYGWKMGRLSTVTTPTGTISYLYDAAGHRIARQVIGAVTDGYVWGSGGQLLADTDSTGAIVDRFVYASRGSSPDYFTRGGVTYRYVSDERGSIRLVINTSTSAIVQRLEYDEWGRSTSDSNPGFQPLGFAGGIYDPSTGLVHLGAREYDPLSTRWLSHDTIGFSGGANQYTYANDDPVNQIDPTGHDALGCFADILGLASLVPGVGPAFAVAYSAVQAARGHWGEAALGLAAVAIPFAILGGLARTGKVAAEGASARGGLSEAFHYTRPGNAAAIAEDGLRTGSYATPNGGLSGVQAQIDLALPPNRGLSSSVIRVDLDGLRAAGYEVPEPTLVGRSYGSPGGGYEMQFPYVIPPEFLKVIR